MKALCRSPGWRSLLAISLMTVMLFSVFGLILACPVNVLDGDGLAREASEPGLPGWQIYVNHNDNGVWDANDEPMAVTAADGSWMIDGITEGTFKVREVPQAPWVNSYPTLHYYSETLHFGDRLTGNDFGNHLPFGSLEITTIVDFNDVICWAGISEDFTVKVSGPSCPLPTGITHVFHLLNGVLQLPNPWVLDHLLPGDYTITLPGSSSTR